MSKLTYNQKIRAFSLCLIFLANMLFAQQKSLFLVAGQSNAVGQGNQTLSAKCAVETAFEYRFTNDTLVYLSDPVGANELYFQKANTGSICPAFAKRYYELNHKQIIIVSTARGGASCHHKAEITNAGTWDISGNLKLFENSIIKVLKASHKTGLKLSGIIWLQGERDANAILDKQLSEEEYEAALRRVIQRFREKLEEKLPFYIIQTGYQDGRSKAGGDAVRNIQNKIAKTETNTYIVYTETHTFLEKVWMKDFVHYNQTGLNDIGETIAEQIVKIETTLPQVIGINRNK